MLVAKRNMMSGKKLPYAKRLAYLTREQYDDGTELHGRAYGPYIDTGVIPDENCDFYVKFLTRVEFIRYGFHIFGTRVGSGLGLDMKFALAQWSNGQFWLGNGGYGTNKITKDTVHSVSKKGLVYTDTNGVDHAISSTHISPPHSLILFGCWRGQVETVPNERFPGRIYAFKLWKNGKLVLDYIPVLDKNGRPAMYNKANGELVYNSGEGEFGYGEITNENVGGGGINA